MSIGGWKSLAFIFGVFSVVLLIGCGWLLVENVELSLRASFADDQTQIFQQMCDEALKSDDPHQVAGYLNDVVNYYPSGTKQRSGSHLDLLVERHRAESKAVIVRRLRELKVKDLVNDPESQVNDLGGSPRANR